MNTEDSKKTGRVAASPFKKSVKALIIEYNKKLETETEFKEKFKSHVSSFENPTERDRELIEICDLRFELNKKVEPLRQYCFIYTRRKDLSEDEAQSLESAKEERDALFEQLKEIAPLGMTQKEWDAIPVSERKMGLGRPGVSLETKVMRSRELFDLALDKYRKEEDKLSGDELIEVETLFGSRPISVTNLKNKIKEFTGKVSAGRPSGGEITTLEQKIKFNEKAIQYIENGYAQKELESKLAKRKRSHKGNGMGRPFEDLEEKKERLQNEINDLKAKIESIESKMKPLDLVERKRVIVRKEIKKIERTMKKQSLSEDNDYDNPVVMLLLSKRVEMIGLDKTRKNLIDTRNELPSEPKIATDAIADIPALEEDNSLQTIKIIDKKEQRKEEIAKAIEKAKRLRQARLIKEKMENKKRVHDENNQKSASPKSKAEPESDELKKQLLFC